MRLFSIPLVFSLCVFTASFAMAEPIASYQPDKEITAEDLQIWQDYVQVSMMHKQEGPEAMALADIVSASCLKECKDPLVRDPDDQMLTRMQAATAWLVKSEQARVPEPSAEEIADFIAASTALFEIRPWANMSVIFAAAEPNASPEQVKLSEERIQKASERLASNEPFESVARDVSEGTSALLGGNVGVVQKGKINPQIEEILFAMEPGEIKGPVRLTHGFYIFRLNEISLKDSYTEQEKNELAEERILHTRRSNAYQSLIEEASGECSVSFPKGADHKSQQTPWVTSKDGTTYPSRLIFLFCLRNDLGQNEINEAVLEDEAGYLLPTALLGDLARRRGMLDKQEFLQIADCAEKNRLTEIYWNARKNSMHLDETEKENFFRERSADFGHEPLVSGVLVSVQVLTPQELFGLNPLQIHQQLAPVATEMQKALLAQKAESLRDMFPAIQERWKDAELEEFNDVASLGFNIDSIIERMQEGQISEPFERRRHVSVLQLDKRTIKEPTFEEIKESIEPYWQNLVFPDIRKKEETAILEEIGFRLIERENN